MLKAIEEVTEWVGDFKAPNHVYLMDGDKALGYMIYGEGKQIYFKSPIRLDKRYRKFITLEKNPFTEYKNCDTIDDVEEKKNIVSVAGSKGAIYQVDLDAKTCTCPAFMFRGASCKHIKQVLDTLN